ncbi:MAG TPA: hypothetical protein VNE21_06200 [Mycobacteriales bacterium]|nr:hypothetical protein [Mycobacteriales bacterium]
MTDSRRYWPTGVEDPELTATRSREPEFLGLDEQAARALARRLGLQILMNDADNPPPRRPSLQPRRITVYLSAGTVVRTKAG